MTPRKSTTSKANTEATSTVNVSVGLPQRQLIETDSIKANLLLREAQLDEIRSDRADKLASATSPIDVQMINDAAAKVITPLQKEIDDLRGALDRRAAAQAAADRDFALATEPVPLRLAELGADLLRSRLAANKITHLGELVVVPKDARYSRESSSYTGSVQIRLGNPAIGMTPFVVEWMLRGLLRDLLWRVGLDGDGRPYTSTELKVTGPFTFALGTIEMVDQDELAARRAASSDAKAAASYRHFVRAGYEHTRVGELQGRGVRLTGMTEARDA